MDDSDRNIARIARKLRHTAWKLRKAGLITAKECKERTSALKEMEETI